MTVATKVNPSDDSPGDRDEVEVRAQVYGAWDMFITRSISTCEDKQQLIDVVNHTQITE